MSRQAFREKAADMGWVKVRQCDWEECCEMIANVRQYR